MRKVFLSSQKQASAQEFEECLNGQDDVLRDLAEADPTFVFNDDAEKNISYVVDEVVLTSDVQFRFPLIRQLFKYNSLPPSALAVLLNQLPDFYPQPLKLRELLGFLSRAVYVHVAGPQTLLDLFAEEQLEDFELPEPELLDMEFLALLRFVLSGILTKMLDGVQVLFQSRLWAQSPKYQIGVAAIVNYLFVERFVQEKAVLVLDRLGSIQTQNKFFFQAFESFMLICLQKGLLQQQPDLFRRAAKKSGSAAFRLNFALQSARLRLYFADIVQTLQTTNAAEEADTWWEIVQMVEWTKDDEWVVEKAASYGFQMEL